MSKKKAYRRGLEAGRAEALAEIQRQREERAQQREGACALLLDTVLVVATIVQLLL